MIVHEIDFYRRIINGWELSEIKLFSSIEKAKKYLNFYGYNLIEENLYQGSKFRAILIEKEVE